MLRLRPEIALHPASGLEGLKAALQSAIELEHATIPPYLYALYSIRPGTNRRLAQIARSVVLEEMLHMSLCCNILNAIGGHPALDHREFVPTYPGPLPGTVGDINVPLAPISKELIHDVFMVIEEPEDPINFPVEHLTETAAPLTIGQFYHAVKDQMARLAADAEIFVGDPTRQLQRGVPGVRAVTDLKSANEAIDLIVAQGEGTTTSPLSPGKEPAHYYLFASAYHGRELVARDGDPPFAYGGDAIPFDEQGIVPFATNPTPQRYAGTAAATANDHFNATYTQLLRALHETFNGAPLRITGSIALMRRLAFEARALGDIEIAPGIHAGPTFTYLP